MGCVGAATNDGRAVNDHGPPVGTRDNGAYACSIPQVCAGGTVPIRGASQAFKSSDVRGCPPTSGQVASRTRPDQTKFPIRRYVGQAHEPPLEVDANEEGPMKLVWTVTVAGP